jgi:hypothetical protein
MNVTLISESHPDKFGKAHSMYRCICGNTFRASNSKIKSGHTSSCGCLRKKHGGRDHPTYNVWRSMKKRCMLPTHKSYKDYGGRGISVSEDWLNFKNFYNDMLPTYKKGLTLNRIDNSRGYSKENCEWTTVQSQNENTRANKRYNGVLITHISRQLGGNNGLVHDRLKQGWTIEEACTKPLRVQNKLD